MLTFVYFGILFSCGVAIGSVLAKNGIEFGDLDFWIVVIAYGVTIALISCRDHFLPEALL